MAYIGKEPANVGQRPQEDTFTATAAQTVFTLTADVDYESDIFVSINGVIQTNAAFALSGTGSRTLTFVSGITLGDVVRVLHHGYKPMTVSVADDIVTTQNVVEASVEILDSSVGASAWRYLVKNAPVPSGGSLMVIAGQKIVLEAGDKVRITSSAASVMDAVAAILEDVNS